MFRNNTVTCSYGTLRGAEEDGVSVFRGVPFAMPPVGPLRWRAPRKPLKWAGVRPATEFAAAPMQLKGKLTDYHFSEDCLYLNIWTPAETGDEKLPVFVWFYGGSYMAGRSDDPTFNGVRFAKRGIITVTVNYRVGVFGFMCHPDMNEAGELERGNFGLMDQIASLEWIRDNIAFFGGDPGNVTIAGQSAGSNSVNNLMVSPLSRTLFQKAINQSGDVLQPERDITFEEACETGVKLQQLLGCKDLDEMRALPTEAYQTAEEDMTMKNGMNFTPFIDGKILPRATAAMLLTNDAMQIPIMIGTCEDEGSSGRGNYVERICERFGLPRDIYPDESRETVKHLARDYWYARHIAWIDIRANDLKLPTYHYNYVHRTEPMGAQHGTEIPFIFGTLDRMKDLNGNVYDEKDREFSEMIGSYWANFIKTGDPNGEGLMYWPLKDEKPVHFRLENVCSMENDCYRPEHEYILEPAKKWLRDRKTEYEKEQ